MWTEYDRITWLYRRPSRRLRKLYSELAALEREMDKVRASNPVPEHAPSSCRIVSRMMRGLRQRHADLVTRIERLQNQRGFDDDA